MELARRLSTVSLLGAFLMRAALADDASPEELREEPLSAGAGGKNWTLIGGPGPDLEDAERHRLYFSTDIRAQEDVHRAEDYRPEYPELSSPSSAPTLSFYVYRSQGPALPGGDYPLANVNVASIGGALWYLHNEVIGDTHYQGKTGARRFDITRIRRFKVTYKPTEPLWKRGMSFGMKCSFDSGQCTGPHRWGNSEFKVFGYYIGCDYLGDFPHDVPPFSTTGKRYPEAIWYSIPGACPQMDFRRETPACKAEHPGGHCSGGSTPSGTGDCTYTYEDMGEIDIDELVGITPKWRSRKEFVERGCVEKDGWCIKWWNNIWDENANKERVRQTLEAFRRKYPNSPSHEDLLPPKCDFNRGRFNAANPPPPTLAPTRRPTRAPTTPSPTSSPTKAPTPNPTLRPTFYPTRTPTVAPTTVSPTPVPTPQPTSEPTVCPTPACTGDAVLDSMGCACILPLLVAMNVTSAKTLASEADDFVKAVAAQLHLDVDRVHAVHGFKNGPDPQAAVSESSVGVRRLWDTENAHAAANAASALTSVRQLQETAIEWNVYGGNGYQVPHDEGRTIRETYGPITHCKAECESDKACNSFTICGSRCWLKDKHMSGDEPGHANPQCSMLYLTRQTTIAKPRVAHKFAHKLFEVVEFMILPTTGMNRISADEESSLKTALVALVGNDLSFHGVPVHVSSVAVAMAHEDQPSHAGFVIALLVVVPILCLCSCLAISYWVYPKNVEGDDARGWYQDVRDRGRHVAQKTREVGTRGRELARRARERGSERARELGTRGAECARDLGTSGAQRIAVGTARAREIGARGVVRGRELGAHGVERARDLGASGAQRIAAGSTRVREFGAHGAERARELGTRGAERIAAGSRRAREAGARGAERGREMVHQASASARECVGRVSNGNDSSGSEDARGSNSGSSASEDAESPQERRYGGWLQSVHNFVRRGTSRASIETPRV